MQRRQVVRSLAVLAVGAAGCSEAPSPAPAPPNGPPPEPDDGGDGGSRTITRTPLQVENDYTWRESENGTVLLDVTVTNPAPTERVATLRITATLDGEEIVQQRHLNLASGEQTDLTVTFDFDYDAWVDGSKGLDFSFDYQS